MEGSLNIELFVFNSSFLRDSEQGLKLRIPGNLIPDFYAAGWHRQLFSNTNPHLTSPNALTISIACSAVGGCDRSIGKYTPRS